MADLKPLPEAGQRSHRSLRRRLPPPTIVSAKIGNQSLSFKPGGYFFLLYWPDYGHAQAAAVEAVAGDGLDVFGGDFEDFFLEVRGVQDFSVAEERFAHPHDLVR